MRLRVLIPVAAATLLAAPAGASAAFPHLVAPGESLSSVAATDGLTVEQLAAANGLSPEASLISGSTLMIPSQEAGTTGEGASSAEERASSTEESASNTESASSAGSYVVQPGDTLSTIAAAAGTSVGELAAANGIDPNETLLSGAVLRLSGASAEAGQSAAPSTEASSSSPPYPTEESVSPSEVGSIAAENGVSPSLAEAIAEQESGFNNNIVSSADARGVMQILPETWSWIDQELAGSAHLAPASAASNVRGGVLLLHSLLNETGGDAGLAAAGYYQGLPSVLQEGQLPSTERYVASVLALKQRFGGE
jgi:soluble lytic murein transglycosylase-like protein